MKLNEIKQQKAGDLDKVKNYTSGNLDIPRYRLSSLEGCPKEVNGDFDCSDNLLMSLEGCPKEVSKYFFCAFNKLTSLKGCPKEMYRFTCSENKLTSLEGGPETLRFSFECWSNKLSSFEHFPKYIGEGGLNISGNKFTSFKDIDKHIQFIGNIIIANRMKITSGYSDLFGIDGLSSITFNDTDFECSLENIVNKYLPTKDVINFQDEMIKSGFDSYL